MISGSALPLMILAVAASAGIFLVLFGLFADWSSREARLQAAAAQPVKKKSSASVSELAIRLSIAAGAAIVSYLISGWVVLGLYAFGGGFVWYSVRKSAQAKKKQLEQILALATWIESLKDTMAASAGISEALAISAQIAPAPIAKELQNLVIRMERQPTPVALQQFAAEIENPVADMIVASFSLALTKQAGGLQHILGAISQNARDTATMLREIETGRSEVKTQAKLAVGVIGAVCLFMIITQRDALVAYDNFVGQVALATILGVFSFAGFLLYQLSKAQPINRVFSRVATDPAVPGEPVVAA